MSTTIPLQVTEPKIEAFRAKGPEQITLRQGEKTKYRAHRDTLIAYVVTKGRARLRDMNGEPLVAEFGEGEEYNGVLIVFAMSYFAWEGLSEECVIESRTIEIDIAA